MKYKLLILGIFCLMNIAFAKETAGLKTNGLDSIVTNKQYGYDFVMKSACSTYTYNSNYNCYNDFHIWFHGVMQAFRLSVDNGYGINVGKMCLDSIKTAPADTDSRWSVIPDSIKSNKLSTYLGNSYIFHCGSDPRDGSKIYAKMRIIKLIPIDSINFRMVFLWVANISGGLRDLNVQGVDTFFRSTNVTYNKPGVYNNGLGNMNNVFKVVGDRFEIPNNLAESATSITVYTLTGKKLGRMALGKSCRFVDLSEMRRLAKGVLVVRVGRVGSD